MRALWMVIFFVTAVASTAFGDATPAVRPVISMMTTCAQLTQNFYPADTTTWFDAGKNPQIVFYAHMLFPLRPEQDALTDPARETWHPPQVAPVLPAVNPGLTLSLRDDYYAQAQWLDSDGLEVASLGLTMPARVSADYVRLGSRQYIPHTFTMTLGIKDIRAQAGQKTLLSKNGQYHIRLYVDSQLAGIAFFRMSGLVPAMSTAPVAVSAPTGKVPVTEPGTAALEKALAPSGSSAMENILRLLTQTAK